MSLEDVQKEIETLQKEIDEKIRSIGQPAVEAHLTETFKKYPDIGIIHWEAYTPYFNDGDECTFRIHGPNVLERRESLPEAAKDDFEDMSDIVSSSLPSEVKELYRLQEWDCMGEYGDCSNRVDIWKYKDILRKVFGESHSVIAAWHNDTIYMSVDDDFYHE